MHPAINRRMIAADSHLGLDLPRQDAFVVEPWRANFDREGHPRVLGEAAKAALAGGK